MADRRRGNNAGDTTGRKKERGEAKKDSSKSEKNADYADATLSWRKVNSEVRTTPCFALHMTRNCALDVSNIRSTTVDESLCRTCRFHGHLVTSVFETMHSSSATVLLSLRLRCPTSFSRGLLATQMSGVVCLSDEFVHERGQWLRGSVSCGHLDCDLWKPAVNLIRFLSCVRDAVTIMFTPAHPLPVFVEHGSRLCCGPSAPLLFVSINVFVDILNERMRGYWLARTLVLSEQEISGIRIVTEGSTGTVCCEEGNPADSRCEMERGSSR